MNVIHAFMYEQDMHFQAEEEEQLSKVKYMLMHWDTSYGSCRVKANPTSHQVWFLMLHKSPGRSYFFLSITLTAFFCPDERCGTKKTQHMDKILLSSLAL